MQGELVDLLFGDLGEQFPDLIAGCNKSFINHLNVSLSYRSMEHNQVIQSPNYASENAYFIMRGAVAICEPTCYQEPILVYGAGAFFNFYQILVGTTLNFSFKALSSSYYKKENDGFIYFDANKMEFAQSPH